MRRIVSLLLTLTLVLGLCACGQKAGAAWQEQYDLGVRYLTDGNYPEAIIAFTAAIEIDAKRPEGYIGRGDAYALSGDTEDNLSAALSDYEEAIALDETAPGAWLGLADVYIRRGDYEKAMEILREALEKTGNDQSIADKLSEMESGRFYDSVGSLRRDSFYDGDGALLCYFTYTYDAQGRTASVTGFDAAGNQAGHVELAYSEDGTPLNHFHIAGLTGELGETVYTYDERGNVTQEVWYSSAGEVELYLRYAYDGSGNRTQMEQLSPDGEVQLRTTYLYDGAGHPIREELFDPEGMLLRYTLREYDSSGRESQWFQYDQDGTLQLHQVNHWGEPGDVLHYELYDGAGGLIESGVSGD